MSKYITRLITLIIIVDFIFVNTVYPDYLAESEFSKFRFSKSKGDSQGEKGIFPLEPDGLLWRGKGETAERHAGENYVFPHEHLAVDSKIDSVFGGFSVLKTPMALHSAVTARDITGLGELAGELDNIKELLIKNNILSRDEAERYYTMIFTDSNGLRAYYYFNTNGYFFRITNNGEDVRDNFYTAFLKTEGSKQPEVIIDGYRLEGYIVTKRNREAIFACIKGLYEIPDGRADGRGGASAKLHLFPQGLYYRYLEKGESDPGGKIKELFDRGIARYDSRRKMAVINKDGLESMQKVLTRVFDRAVSKMAIERVLRWHEKFEEFIENNRISFTSLLGALEDQPGGRDGIDRLLDGFCNNYNYPRNWPREDLVRELLVHTLVERLFFKRPVMLLYSKKTDGFHREYTVRSEDGDTHKYYAYNLDSDIEGILLEFARDEGIDFLQRSVAKRNDINIVASIEDRDLSKIGADIFVAGAIRAIQEKGLFYVALPVGKTPREIYRMLCTDEYKDLIDWQKVHIFAVDERAVPRNSENSNYRWIQDELVTKLNIPKANVHLINGEAKDKKREAERYAEELRKDLGENNLDLVLLGIGGDGHIAGIHPPKNDYPGSPVLTEEITVSVIYDERKGRFTLTKGPILRAKKIVLITSGKNKAEPVNNFLSSKDDVLQVPARLLYEAASKVTLVSDTIALEKAMTIPLRPEIEEPGRINVRTGWLFEPSLDKDRYSPEEEDEVDTKMRKVQEEYGSEVKSIEEEGGRQRVLKRWRGWVYSDLDWANPMIIGTIEKAHEIRDRFEAFVHVGIGGSDQTTKAIVNATINTQHNLLSKEERGGSPQIYYTGDTFDPNSIVDILKVLDSQGILFKTVFNIASKSGTTAETVHAFLIIRSYLELRLRELSQKLASGEIHEDGLTRLGLTRDDLVEVELFHNGKKIPYYKTGRYFVFTTGLNEKSALFQYARLIESVGDKVFGLLPVPEGTGGRFSFATSVGLLALGITANTKKDETPAGRIMDVLKAVKDVREEVLKGDVSGDNVPSYAIARANYIAGTKKGKNVLAIFPYANKLQEFANLMMQLFTESNQEGGKGLNILPLVGPARNHSVVNGFIGGPRDKIVCFIKVGEFEEDEISRISGAGLIGGELVDLEGLRTSQVQGASYGGTIRNLVDNGVLSYEIRIPALTPYWVARLITVMEHAVAIEGKLLDIPERYEKGEYVSLTYLQDHVEGYKAEMRRILKRMRATKASPIRKLSKGEQVDLWKAEVKGDGGLVNPVGLNPGYHKFGQIDLDKLQRVLDRIGSEQGKGIFGVIDEIRVSDNIKGSTYAMVVKEDGKNILLLDVDAFLDEDLLYIVLEHELKESIMTVIPYEDEAIRELTANYMSLKLALEKGIRADKDRLRELGADLQFFEVLEVLQGMGDVTDEKIIAVAIEYMRNMPYYADLFRQFSFSGEWQERIREAEDRYKAAMSVFNEIAGTKEVAGKVKETADLTIKVIKTFTGMRIEGLDRLNKKLAGIVAAAVRVASKTDEIASLPLAMTEGRYYIVVDRNRVTKEMEEAIRRLEKNGVFKVVYKVPEDYDLKKVIHLVDPGDLREGMQEGILYLPMPYLRSSLYMAANIVSAGGEVDKVDPLVKGLIVDLYKITDEELIDLFNTPWRLLPKIQSVISELNKLREALAEIEKAA